MQPEMALSRRPRGATVKIGRAWLSVMQATFVRHYLAGRPGVRGNATKSAVAAGYSGQSGQKVLLHPRVRAALEDENERAGLRAQEILAEIRAVALSRMDGIASWGPEGVVIKPHEQLDPEDLAAVAEVRDHTRRRVVMAEEPAAGAAPSVVIEDREVRVKLHDKVEALRLAAKVLGLLKDKVELEVPSLFPAGFFAAVVTGDVSKLPPAFRTLPPAEEAPPTP